MAMAVGDRRPIVLPIIGDGDNGGESEKGT